MAFRIQPGVSKRDDFHLVASQTAVLVIDIQDHLSSPVAGREQDAAARYLHCESLPLVLGNIATLLSCARSIRDHDAGGCEVILTYLQAHTEDCRDVSLDYKLSGPALARLPHPRAPATFSDLDPAVAPSSAGRGDIALPKTSCSVFQSTNIRYVLANLGVRQLVVCGQLTDQCVLSAVRDAADVGLLVTVVEDACAALSQEEHDRGIAGMQGFARIKKTSKVVEELKNSAREQGLRRQPMEGAAESDLGPCRGGTKNTSPEEKAVLEECNDGQIRVPEASLWKRPREYQQHAAVEALLHSLQFSGVEFLRFACVDVSNSIRAKSVPIQRLVAATESPLPIQTGGVAAISDIELDDRVSFAKVCIAGLPSFGDVMLPETRLDARDVLMVRPDLRSLRVLPHAPRSALVLGTLHDQRTGALSEFCPRGMLWRALAAADEGQGIGFSVGAEIEFCLVRAAVECEEAPIPIDTSLFAGTTALDDREDFVRDVCQSLARQRIAVEMIHAESAPGQMELVIPYEHDVMRLADNIVFARETIRACAKKHAMRASFLPKAYGGHAGNGMHVHVSLRNTQSAAPLRNTFPGTTSFSMSSAGKSFVEGVLTHLEALLGITMAMPNSYSRVGKGCWTGHAIGWRVEDKESPVRVCLDARQRAATNVEFKLIDNTCNVYLALAAVLWAGFDGIVQQRQLRPEMGDKTELQSLPTSLATSLDCLEKSALFEKLFGNNLLASYVAVKRAEIRHDNDMGPGFQKYLAQELTK